MSNHAARKSQPNPPKTILDLDVVQAEASFEPFRFILDGEERELPHASMLTGEQAVVMEEGDMRQVLSEVSGDLGPRLMQLPAHALEKLFKAWLDHAGTSQGE